MRFEFCRETLKKIISCKSAAVKKGFICDIRSVIQCGHETDSGDCNRQRTLVCVCQ
jgi:hypothetical protein